jgi:ubiquinone/menaquinone biosynthesis C-methylase UbiE
MAKVIDNYCEFPKVLRRPMWQIWHRLLIMLDNEKKVNFMNYGFAKLNGKTQIRLLRQDEKNRYCIQLYDHVACGTELNDKVVLEVGSGRGGGADYITRYYKPKKYTGVDISSGVINFCNKKYNTPGLHFIKGRAEKIPVRSGTLDAVVNIESARCYSDIKTFFNEVYRVLKPDGYFLFADLIEKNEVNDIRKKLESSNFNIKQETDITKNVAKGLEMDSSRRERQINKKIPGFLKKAFHAFAATKGTKRFDSFRNGKFEYRSFVIRKK